MASPNQPHEELADQLRTKLAEIVSANVPRFVACRLTKGCPSMAQESSKRAVGKQETINAPSPSLK